MYMRKKNISLVKIICLSTIFSNNVLITRAHHQSEGSACTTDDGSPGICSNAKNCEYWMKKMLKQQFPQGSDHCGYSGYEIVVCCPQAQQSTNGPLLSPHDEGASCIMETDNGPGVCKAIHKCEFRINQIRQGKRFDVKEGHCSFVDDTEIVCCPLNERPAPILPQPNARPAEKACQEYQAMVTGKDGLDVDQYIISGEKAESGEFPFMAALGYKNNPDNKAIISYICGGSLITARHVLTAAHCILNIHNYRPTEVRLGSVSLIDESQYVQRIPIDDRDIIIHPGFRISKNYYDIAIITMKQSVRLSNKAMPICLQTSPLPLLQSYLNSQMIVTGWGITNINDDRPSENLKKTRKLSLIDQQTCTAYFNTSRRIPNGVDDSLLCILDENPVNRSDACQGDSGGPLFLKSTLVGSLIGIVSFGNSCASSAPGIYTNVYAYLDWIEPIVWPRSQG